MPLNLKYVRFGRLCKALDKADKQTYERIQAVDPLLARKLKGSFNASPSTAKTSTTLVMPSVSNLQAA